MTRNAEQELSRAAIIALGKVKRRQQDPVSEEFHNALFESLVEIVQAGNYDSSQRQLAFLSLLSFASDLHNPLSSDYIGQLEEAVNAETNKYARSTGGEVLARLCRLRRATGP
jgi:hypothetical protein